MRSYNPTRITLVNRKHPAGTRFGKLTLVHVYAQGYYAEVKCDCGQTTEIHMKKLLSGAATDCGKGEH